MIVFKIGDTNFGVDLSESKVTLISQANGLQELNIDVHGNKEVFMGLTEAEDAEWSWALYPPSFFVHGFQISPGGTELAQPLDINGNSHEFEFGIYMMEYSDLSDVSIQELSAARLKISGKVDFLGKNLPFEIDMPLEPRTTAVLG